MMIKIPEIKSFHFKSTRTLYRMLMNGREQYVLETVINFIQPFICLNSLVVLNIAERARKHLGTRAPVIILYPISGCHM